MYITKNIDNLYNESIIFLKTSRYWYWACDAGIVTRTSVKSLTEKRLKTFINNNAACIKLNGKQIRLKRLIAKLFIHDYKANKILICIDNNEMNCNINNLKLIDRIEGGSTYGSRARSIPVKITMADKTIKIYPSKTAAAKALFVSKQCLRDYMNNKFNKSCLDNYNIAPLCKTEMLRYKKSGTISNLHNFPKNEKINAEVAKYAEI